MDQKSTRKREPVTVKTLLKTVNLFYVVSLAGTIINWLLLYFLFTDNRPLNFDFSNIEKPGIASMISIGLAILIFIISRISFQKK